MCRFIVYSLNGDLLRVVEEQKVEIKSVFLNSREDYLCVAANCTLYGQKRGWFRVLSLYGLNLVADLTETIYTKTLKSLSKIKPDEQVQIPMIQAIAVGAHERNINIFFVKQRVN